MKRRKQVSLPRLWVDLCLLGAIWSVSLMLPVATIFGVQSSGRSVAHSGGLAAVAVLASTATLWRRGVFRRPALPRIDETAANLASVGIAAASVAITAASANLSIGVTELLVGLTATFTVRGLSASLVRAVRLPQQSYSRVLLIGTGPAAVEVAALVEDHPESRLRLVGFLGSAHEVGVSPRLGSTTDLEAVAVEHMIDVVLLAAAENEGHTINDLVTRSQALGLEVLLCPGVSHLGVGRISARSLSHAPLVAVRPNGIRFSHRVLKRGMDVSGALLGLVLLSPLMAIIAVAIKLSDGGPIIYRNRRFGRNAEEFAMLKFRSMRVDADDLLEELREQNQRTGPLFKISRDPRVTRVGQVLRDVSLDELPQLVNVLRGDMSLVGPRPATVEEEAAFAGKHRRRFNVRPGLSGLWQVEARSHPSFSAYRRLDLHYLENWTLGLDLLIIIATVFQVAASLVLAPLARFGIAATPDDVTLGLDLTAIPDSVSVAPDQ